MPTQYGESVVLRLLDQSDSLMTLEQLGMPPACWRASASSSNAQRRHGAGHRPDRQRQDHHAVLGAELSESPDTKILTVEDPVEYRLDRVNQVQVNAKIGLDFARVLRTTLRQDPDVILVGEMRDRETVEIGLRAAITGHLVFSTLHTMNAAATVHRLLDMGVAGYMIATALHGIVAQRLVRRVCDGLRAADRADDAPARVAAGAGRIARASRR